MGGAVHNAFAQALGKVQEAWRAAGREGRPRTMALCYFALGDTAEESARSALGDYYGFVGPYAERLIASTPTDEGGLRDLLAAFDEAGTDEVICFPTSPDPAQVDLLARVALTQSSSSAGTG